MKELNHCPSTLADGFSTYSPTACKKLFDGQKVSHLLDFEIDEISKTSETMIAMRRISVSGAQEKFPAVIENGIIRISQTDERSRYILKPAPWDNTLYTRKQIPANEHLTMQIASQVYGIITAENGLCFTADKAFEINVSEYSSEDLTAARHTDELHKSGSVLVRIDYKNAGIGSNSCGPELLPQYRFSDKQIDFGFTVEI